MTEWNIKPIWKNREKYTLLQLSYIACNENPNTVEAFKNNPDETVLECFIDIEVHLGYKPFVSDYSPNSQTRQEYNPFDFFENQKGYRAPSNPCLTTEQYRNPRLISTERYSRVIDRNKASKTLDSLGLPNFLKAEKPAESLEVKPNLLNANETDVIQVDKPLTDTERNKLTKQFDSERKKLLKQIGVLAVLLSDKDKKYQRGGKINKNAISEAVQQLVESQQYPGKTGTGDTETRKSITEGLKLLEEIE